MCLKLQLNPFFSEGRLLDQGLQGHFKPTQTDHHTCPARTHTQTCACHSTAFHKLAECLNLYQEDRPASSGFTSTSLEKFLRWRLHNLSGQPASPPVSPQGEEVFLSRLCSQNLSVQFLPVPATVPVLLWRPWLHFLDDFPQVPEGSYWVPHNLKPSPGWSSLVPSAAPHR